MKLCYVEGAWAYFTEKPITGEGCQWGDDWDDAPYEHNAGEPYDAENIVKVAWDGPLETPGCWETNSQYSVERINAGAAAWLTSCRWNSRPIVTIPAGTTLNEFIKLVESAGGNVYTLHGART